MLQLLGRPVSLAACTHGSVEANAIAAKSHFSPVLLRVVGWGYRCGGDSKDGGPYRFLRC